MGNVNSDGSELHRLKVMEDYDEALFNKLYKSMKPLVRRLAKNIDARRFNVPNDVIQSYFWDKFLYVFNKYEPVYEEERLRATLISSLMTFKNRLLRKAYTDQSEYYQALTSFEDLFDDSKELIDDVEERERIKDMHDQLYNFMKLNLSPDAYLLFEVQNDPPDFIKDQLKTQNSKISTVMLLDFFDLPRNKTHANFIAKLRKEIEDNIEKAKAELK